MRHENNHRLDLACMDCVLKHLEHKKLLLDFASEIANEFRDNRHRDDISMEEREMITKAKQLIEKIKADND